MCYCPDRIPTGSSTLDSLALNEKTPCSVAFRLSSLGYWVTPAKAKTKRPILTNWQNVHISPDDVPTHFSSDTGVGLLLGKPVNSKYLTAIDIDVDDPTVISRVCSAVGFAPSKKGSKGVTLFVESLQPQRNQKVYSTVDGKRSAKPVIEILSDGNQTIIPPSIHPNGSPYVWLTPDIAEFSNIPVLTESMLDEIFLTVKNPDSPILRLGEMVWAGVGLGGDTHDICVAAVAAMVSKGWPDEYILVRVERAKREACERSGFSYSWPESHKVISDWVNSARSKGFGDSAPKVSGENKLPKARIMGNWVVDKVGGNSKLWKYSGELRRYKDGHWPAINKSRLASSLFHEFSSATAQDIEQAMKTASLSVPATGPFETRAVCFTNGTYNLRSGELQDWNPDDRLLLQMPFDCSPDAVCPNYTRKITSMFKQHRDESYEIDERSQEELDIDAQLAVECFEQFAGLSMVDDMSFQKALFIRGSPGGGKSVLTELLLYVHGCSWSDAETATAVSLSELDSEKIRTALIGKLLNISPELDVQKPLAVRPFKAITGGDPVDARFLYENVMGLVRLRVRFLAFCNEIPPYADPTGAIERRIIVIPADNPVPENERTVNFFRDCIKPEVPGILNRWMAALKRLYAAGKFTVPGSSKRAVAAMAIENDSVRSWVTDRLEHDEQGKVLASKHPTPSAELYADYLSYCQTTNRRYPLASNNWGRHLIHFGVAPKLVRVGGKVTRCRNVSLINGGDF